MKIGIVGAGFVGRAIAKLALSAGHEVMLSNSRSPNTLFSLKPMIGCEIGSPEDAASFGDVVVLAIPMSAINDLPAKALQYKQVIDAMNYYPERDGIIEELESNTLTTSELISRVIPTSHITKAFNAIPMTELEQDGLPKGENNRRALPFAGNDEKGKKIVTQLYEEFGFDPLDVGSLSESWKFERGRPVYCVRMNKTTLEEAIKNTMR
ncbi:NADPH-dependent F420 reductase [Xenorhabdus griffiniae]|uniref:NADPH-dependent F420 reductase n=1 Tax=Xenorhabdus griffiniae TaxID=351672 RepID=A0ABY9XKM8_9GAMM|nr:NADPH-dependent F420 reductase [Xenorhabdus griffiniae]MBD1228925.1 NADPH-dependent F420 reductase [Xenorhabdus griffiniae]MBE8588499.1 NADPH-dependent F420 reductase [Xenorhabdus griffiniae]WMV73437.1 NADPH-dependent F420 reductase [Xenorhabdus griffiniae]WNH03116.1 NADPH-dependent F420 reductase [Xenorhabdus griffiniae]